MQPLTLSLDLSDPAATPRRRAGRVRVCGLATSLGQALDVSAGGMRVLCPGRPPKTGSEVVLRIVSSDGHYEFGARIVWTKRARGGSELGLEFLDLTPEMRQEIRRVAIGSRSEA